METESLEQRTARENIARNDAQEIRDLVVRLNNKIASAASFGLTVAASVRERNEVGRIAPIPVFEIETYIKV
jgi:hypothetical protein